VKSRNTAVKLQGQVRKLRARLHATKSEGAYDNVHTALDSAIGEFNDARAKVMRASTNPADIAESRSMLGKVETITGESFQKFGDVQLGNLRKSAIEFVKDFAGGIKSALVDQLPDSFSGFIKLGIKTVVPGGTQLVGGWEVAQKGFQQAFSTAQKAGKLVQDVRGEITKTQAKLGRAAGAKAAKLQKKLGRFEGKLKRVTGKAARAYGQVEQQALKMTDKLPDPRLEIVPQKPSKAARAAMETAVEFTAEDEAELKKIETDKAKAEQDLVDLETKQQRKLAHRERAYKKREALILADDESGVYAADVAELQNELDSADGILAKIGKRISRATKFVKRKTMDFARMTKEKVGSMTKGGFKATGKRAGRAALKTVKEALTTQQENLSESFKGLMELQTKRPALPEPEGGWADTSREAQLQTEKVATLARYIQHASDQPYGWRGHAGGPKMEMQQIMRTIKDNPDISLDDMLEHEKYIILNTDDLHVGTKAVSSQEFYDREIGDVSTVFATEDYNAVRSYYRQQTRFSDLTPEQQLAVDSLRYSDEAFAEMDPAEGGMLRNIRAVLRKDLVEDNVLSPEVLKSLVGEGTDVHELSLKKWNRFQLNKDGSGLGKKNKVGELEQEHILDMLDEAKRTMEAGDYSDTQKGALERFTHEFSEGHTTPEMQDEVAKIIENLPRNVEMKEFKSDDAIRDFIQRDPFEDDPGADTRPDQTMGEGLTDAELKAQLLRVQSLLDSGELKGVDAEGMQGYLDRAKAGLATREMNEMVGKLLPEPDKAAGPPDKPAVAPAEKPGADIEGYDELASYLRGEIKFGELSQDGRLSLNVLQYDDAEMKDMFGGAVDPESVDREIELRDSLRAELEADGFGGKISAKGAHDSWPEKQWRLLPKEPPKPPVRTEADVLARAEKEGLMMFNEGKNVQQKMNDLLRYSEEWYDNWFEGQKHGLESVLKGVWDDNPGVSAREMGVAFQTKRW